jgi:hypothetical protein
MNLATKTNLGVTVRGVSGETGEGGGLITWAFVPHSSHLTSDHFTREVPVCPSASFMSELIQRNFIKFGIGSVLAFKILLVPLSQLASHYTD